MTDDQLSSSDSKSEYDLSGPDARASEDSPSKRRGFDSGDPGEGEFSLPLLVQSLYHLRVIFTHLHLQ